MMSKYLKLFLLLLGVIVGTGFITLSAQDKKYTQIDMDVILSQKLEKFRDIYQHMILLDRQTQADTLVLTTGQTADTVYLDNKYGDMAFMIFISYRQELGTINTKTPAIIPVSDSSFKITNKNVNDSSVVQWMAIHK